jgi:hypothetical protein
MKIMGHDVLSINGFGIGFTWAPNPAGVAISAATATGPFGKYRWASHCFPVYQVRLRGYDEDLLLYWEIHAHTEGYRGPFMLSKVQDWEKGKWWRRLRVIWLPQLCLNQQRLYAGLQELLDWQKDKTSYSEWQIALIPLNRIFKVPIPSSPDKHICSEGCSIQLLTVGGTRFDVRDLGETHDQQTPNDIEYKLDVILAPENRRIHKVSFKSLFRRKEYLYA